MPGMTVMTAIFGGLTTGLGLTEDLKAGVVDRFRQSALRSGGARIRAAAGVSHTCSPGSARSSASRCAIPRRLNPVSLTVNAARVPMIGHAHALVPTLGTLAWLSGLLLVFAPSRSGLSAGPRLTDSGSPALKERDRVDVGGDLLSWPRRGDPCQGHVDHRVVDDL